ncbi:MFS transporter [Pseudoxanthomonas sp. JBR18]|uniref:MFS transporter n=1 Tax=Pseudoxanthomonas sp. JBR18 TaxID=2969308 RepID=UPI002305CB6C|nr:MFS transporter [Pseudoxanthomonas sp. JBR18]WCE05342.1 MFS transporter [Pseudoxanthomonas sp. JBR18]
MSNSVETGVNATGNRIWITAFVFCFLTMVIDGADVMLLAYSLSSLKDEFNLTSLEAGSLASYTLAGMAVGGIYGGWLADRLGRVKAVVFSVLLFSIGTIFLGFTHSYVEFAVVRGVSALGLGSVYVVCNTLMAEYVPTRYRNTVLGSLQAGWSVGYIVATLLAKWILPSYGWRPLFYTGAVPIAMALLMWKMVPEPATWLRVREQAKRLAASGATLVKEKGKFNQIFSSPKAARMFALWAVTAGFLQFGNYGVNNWMPSYLESELGMKFKTMTTFLVGTYGASILGKVLAGYVADKVGRRTVFAFGCLGTALFLPIIVLFNNPQNILWLLIVFGFLYGVPYSVNATYMTESFEAKYRGSAVGGAYNVGRIGAALSPAVIGFFATRDSIGFGFLLVGAAYLICGLIPAIFIRDKQYDPVRE